MGFFVNNLIPARMGEFVRAHLGGRATDQSRSTVLATIAGERLADGLTISLIFSTLFSIGATTEEFSGARELSYVAFMFLLAAFGTAPLELGTLWQIATDGTLYGNSGQLGTGLVRVGAAKRQLGDRADVIDEL